MVSVYIARDYAIVRRGYSCGWYAANRLRIGPTPRWEEGHDYQSGFAIDDTAENRSRLDEKGMRYEAVDSLPQKCHHLHAVKIALYDGRGAGRDFSDPLVEVLKAGGFEPTYIGDNEIRHDGLNNYDILVVPGSPDAGECYYAGLGDLGNEKIRRFIAQKGHYLGVCGGAYLPLTSYNTKNNCWLNVVEATDTQDLDYWRTGSGLVRCRIDMNDHPIFSGMVAGITNSINITYWEGPAIEIKGANIKQLAHFERLLASGKEPLKPHWDFHDNTMVSDAVKGWYNPMSQELFDELLVNRCAFGEADYEGHKILLYSPHPEMGNIGYGPRKDSLNFLLLYNGLFYLSSLF